MREVRIYQSRLPDSPDRVWKAKLGRNGCVSSNGVKACLVLPISSNHGKAIVTVRERESQKLTYKERECERENKLPRERD